MENVTRILRTGPVQFLCHVTLFATLQRAYRYKLSLSLVVRVCDSAWLARTATLMGCGQSVPTKAAYDYARKGDVVALRLLLERHEHADYVRVRNLVNLCDPQGLTPLLAACKHPKCTLAVPIVEALIDAGADVAASGSGFPGGHFSLRPRIPYTSDPHPPCSRCAAGRLLPGSVQVHVQEVHFGTSAAA